MDLFNISLPASEFAPSLYIVATPIGNASDITLRALQLLRRADLILCEDTRVTGKLLSLYGIKNRLLAYHDHNAAKQRPQILKELKEGKKVALVSDAGTPLISDPGYKLVLAALEEGVRVETLPGASSALAALTLSGLPTDRFFFEGFLPSTANARKKRLLELRTIPATLIFFESTKRLAATFADMAEVLGERQASMSREITKLFEETRRASLLELAQHYAEAGAPKGEAVIIVAPPGEPQEPIDTEALLLRAMAKHSLKEAVAMVAQETGLSKRALYQQALTLQK